MKFEKFTNLDDHVPGTPLMAVPQEVLKYYMEHGYSEKGIPLNADLCNEIYEKLHGGEE